MTREISFKLVDGEPECDKQECPSYRCDNHPNHGFYPPYYCEQTCSLLGDPDSSVDICIPGLRQQRDEARARLAEQEFRIKRTLNILDTLLGDTDPPEVDYDEKPHGMIIHAMHVLLGRENKTEKDGGCGEA